MKTQKTFKPGDYCRFTPEEIPSIIALLEANGWGVNKHICFNESHDCIIVNEEGGFHSYKLSKSLEAKNAIQHHDFIVTALRLNEGDGMRSDMSTPEQRKHIAEVLIGLGVNYEKTTIPSAVSHCSFILSRFKKILIVSDETVKNHLDYSEWCKRLNETPINHIPDVGKTITLPEGTTVDLTKPLEVSYGGDKWENDELEFHFVGFNNAGHIIVECLSDCELQAVDKIRNKPDPEFKAGDKVWYKHEIIENWEFGVIDDDGDVSYPVSKVKVIGKVSIRRAFDENGNPQYPPFD